MRVRRCAQVPFWLQGSPHCSDAPARPADTFRPSVARHVRGSPRRSPRRGSPRRGPSRARAPAPHRARTKCPMTHPINPPRNAGGRTRRGSPSRRGSRTRRGSSTRRGSPHPPRKPHPPRSPRPLRSPRPPRSPHPPNPKPPQVRTTQKEHPIDALRLRLHHPRLTNSHPQTSTADPEPAAAPEARARTRGGPGARAGCELVPVPGEGRGKTREAVPGRHGGSRAA